MKAKKCKVCKDTFEPWSSLATCCSIPCAVEYSKQKGVKLDAQKAKVERKTRKQALDKLKSRSEYAKIAQRAFNAYIRKRDGNVCISCGTTKPDIQYCAGHYRTRGAAKHLTFNEDNVHSQCNQYCNLNLSGNIVNYRPALIKKIGIERVEALENDNSMRKFTIEQLKAITVEYRKKLKANKS